MAIALIRAIKRVFLVIIEFNFVGVPKGPKHSESQARGGSILFRLFSSQHNAFFLTAYSCTGEIDLVGSSPQMLLSSWASKLIKRASPPCAVILISSTAIE